MKERGSKKVINGKTSKTDRKLGPKKKKLAQNNNNNEKSQSFNNDKKFKYNSSGKWYEEVPSIRSTESTEIKFNLVQDLKKQANGIFTDAVILNNAKPPKTLSNSDYAWVKTVISKGTRTDKVAAYTLLIQDAPLYNLTLLKNMVEMVKIGKNKDCFMAIDTLSELFLNDLLPPNRKLITFEEQPLSKLDELTSGNIVARKRRLLLWYFEDQLKSVYRDFINYLNKIAHDSVDANKEKVITVMCKLLEGNPENENLLLNNIVNKLGDPNHKVGSKVIYALTKLLEVHPNMKEVVAEAVEKVIFRTNVSRRAQYYSVCFLSQFCLFNGEVKLAKHLISIYLCLFKACIKTGDVDSRLMSALLTGVKRAYPFAKEDLGMFKEHINTFYKVIHLSHANIAIQALSLVYLISDYSNAYVDRFYTVLYKKIAEIDMFKSTHHAMLLSLIYKAVKKDKEKARVSAFIKRLLQVALYVPIPVSCGILIMVSEIIKFKDDVLIRNSTPEENVMIKLENDSDDGEEHYVDVKEEVFEDKPPTDATQEESKPDVVSFDKIYNVKPIENFKVWSNSDKSVGGLKDIEIKNYDPTARNPLYSGADKSVAVELFKLSRHFHPTVSVFANKIINGEKVIYSGDPLLDFTLIRFLDKFSFKNPKVIKPEEERKLSFSKFGRKQYYSSATVRRLRANTAAYLNHNEKSIPVDEMFLYKYMKEKMENAPVREKDGDSDLESVGSDEFDEMLSGLGDGKKDDINFLREVGQLPKKTKPKKGKEKEDDESDLELSGESDDEDPTFENADNSDLGSVAEDFEGNELDDFGDDDEEMQGSDIDEAELESHFQGLDLSKLPSIRDSKKKVKGKNKDFKNQLFASADEFSELLEQTDLNAGSSEAFSNKDKAGIKQLKWESDRDKWIHKKNYRSKQIKKPRTGMKNQKFLKGKKKKRF